MFGGVNPVFRVRDLEASIAYYAATLGVQLDWRDNVGIASVSRGKWLDLSGVRCEPLAEGGWTRAAD